MKTSLLIATLSFLAAPAALACTPEELQAKVVDVVNRTQAIAISSPEKAEALLPKFNEIQAQPITDVEGACRAYDALLVEIAAAE